MAPRDTRLHTVDLKGKSSVEVMVSTPQFGGAQICVDMRSGEDRASAYMTAYEARATAYLLLAAADEIDLRNAVLKPVAEVA